MKKMKKFLCLCLICFVCFALVGCGNKDKDNNNNDNNGNDNININNGNNNNDNQNINNEGRLVSGIFSLEYPEGWEWKNNGGDPEAHDPNSNELGLNSFIQLTIIGSFSDEGYEAVKVGNYTFYSNGNIGSIYLPAYYYYVHNSHTVAMVSFYLMDTETIEEVLSSFRID